jgi:hypothetical protein
MDRNRSFGDVNPSAMSAIRKEMFFAEGRYSAFVFASECKGDLSQLKAEIQQTEILIAEGLSSNPSGSMSPGMSPRIYRDGYLAGLKDAVQIVSRHDAMKQNE